tara:strand:- start:117 stop:569 length:453 start_codon:yes stop_codon:yes gene_type:complete
MKHLRLINFIKFAFIIIFFLIITKEVRAIPNPNPDESIPNIQENEGYQGLIPQQMPVYCGETGFVLKTSQDLMGESQILIGEVRQGGQPFGQLLGIISFGHNDERDSGTFFMTMPQIAGGLTCILGYGLNWHWFDSEGNRILDEDDESKQ